MLKNHVANYQQLLTIDVEEEFCWKFSETVCEILNLPYSTKIAEYQTRIFQLLQKLTDSEKDEDLFSQYDQIIVEGKIKFGYSALASDEQIVWSPEGIPHVVEFIMS